MTDLQIFGDSAGAISLLLLGVALVACGADVCWLRFKRGGVKERQAVAPRRW
ncbi:MAG: hypothetical protein HY079_14245 [Elusimicrobia bacterium]|nr:hypothetical protein [Elusimicrobiota bacterium]